jgi:nucleoside-diphosphate-sugar epimerase
VLDMIKFGGYTGSPDIRFVTADLTKDEHWAEAVKGCQYVLHVASPIVHDIPKDESIMIRPAVDGTLRVLKAAVAEGVKRIVVTSNFGAVGYSHKDPDTVITEKEWTNPEEPGLNTYNKSKVLAERAAWDFMRQAGGKTELTTVNPVAIFGPTLGPDMPSVYGLLFSLLGGRKMPRINMNIVDVRDVADLHIKAMVSPEGSGERFLCLAGGTLDLQQIAVLIKQETPAVAQQVKTSPLPDWVVRVAALFNSQAKTAASYLGISRNVTNEKAKRLLSWQPRFSNEQAVVASVQSMITFGKLK